MERKIQISLFISLIVLAAVMIVIGPMRLRKFREKADRFAEKKDLDVKYECSEKIGSKEELLTEIWKLALWEKETRDAINDAFGYTDRDYSEWTQETGFGYADDEELLASVMREKWYELRTDLEGEVKDAIPLIFDTAGSSYDLNSQAVTACYEEGGFGSIIEVMQAVEDGEGKKAFDLACNQLEKESRALPMDIAYGLRPKLIKAGCEASLRSAVKIGEPFLIKIAAADAEKFGKRYKVEIDGLESAKKKAARQEYERKPDVPAVGMTTSQACSTKLGAPSRTTRETGSWSHQKHTYGDMYWERGDRRLFTAHYCDGEITSVSDTRNSTATSPWVGSSGLSGGSSGSHFDPDDHDIEAYFEDNRDEYDDYDDAYEGFLDDEGVWDDY